MDAIGVNKLDELVLPGCGNIGFVGLSSVCWSSFSIGRLAKVMNALSVETAGSSGLCGRSALAALKVELDMRRNKDADSAVEAGEGCVGVGHCDGAAMPTAISASPMPRGPLSSRNLSGRVCLVCRSGACRAVREKSK